MESQTSLLQPGQIEQAILLIRGQRVMLDRDLAALYGVTTGNLNKAVQRNPDRFPADFMFQLTDDEAKALLFQSGMAKQRGGRRTNPYVFTQEGVAMLSSVLRSQRAVQVNIAIMRVFVRLRETLTLHKDLAHKLTELERRIEKGRQPRGHSLSASIGERARVRCRIRSLQRHPPAHDAAGEAAPRDWFPRQRGQCAVSSETKVTMRNQIEPANLINTQLSTINPNRLRPNDPKPTGKWIERFEEWLVDSGSLNER